MLLTIDVVKSTVESSGDCIALDIGNNSDLTATYV
jgi:hypothetical protein